MAQEYDELIGLLKELLTNRFSPKPSFIRGLLGDGQGNVQVPDKPDKNYVRFNRGTTEFFEVFNRAVNPVNDWPVLIGQLPWQPGLTQVVDTDWSAFEQSGWGDNIGATSPHAPTHEWPDGSPGADPIDIYLRSIVPLRAYTLGTGSTSIYVNSYEYDNTNCSGTVWNGLPGVDLSPVMDVAVTPSGTARSMGIYLNPTTNTLGVVTGSTDIFTDAVFPPTVQFPAGVIPSARVRVYGGQVQINEADIRDARRPFSFCATGTSGGGSPTGLAGGDLTGSYPNPQVAGLFGYDLVDTAPAEGNVLMFSGSAWRPTTFSDGVWPDYNEIKVLKSNGTNIAYSTMAAAVAALAGDEVILIGPGTYTCDSQQIQLALAIVGSGKDVTVLQTSTESEVLWVNGGSTFELLANLTLENSRASANSAALTVTTRNIKCVNVQGRAIGATSGSNYGMATTGAGSEIDLEDCHFEAINASTNNYGINSTIAGDVIRVYQGRYEGAQGDVRGNGGAINLHNPVLVNNVITGTVVTGTWMENDGTLHPSFVPYTSSNPLQQSPVLVGDSDFNGTIATLPGGAVLTYNVSSGDENWLDATSTTALAKLVLHNTTRGNSALISDTDVSTNTITLTATVPGDWQVGDAITIRSQTNTDTSGSAYFLDYEITSEIPADAIAIMCDMHWQDTAVNGQRASIHPYEAFAGAKVVFLNSNTNTILARTVVVPIISNRYTVRADASGSGVALFNLYIMGYFL